MKQTNLVVVTAAESMSGWLIYPVEQFREGPPRDRPPGDRGAPAAR